MSAASSAGGTAIRSMPSIAPAMARIAGGGFGPRSVALKRQSDQVPERTLGQEVLSREEPVVAGQVQLGSYGHGFPEQVDPYAPGRRSGHRRRKERPDVTASARS
jgi:hypothetical protein